MARNSSRAEILRMRLQSKYAALDNLPLSGAVGESHRVVQRRIVLQSEIAKLEKQLEAENAAVASAGSVTSGLQQDRQSTMPTEIKVFYAWQDDLPKEVCRDFIRTAAEAACNIINTENPEYHLVLDEGPLGVPGMCDIPNTILKKIKECDIFLCDLTFVGSYTNRSSTQKKVSNPNVFFEFGFAVGRLGFRRVVGSMNTHYGSPRDHVFDVKRRWALRYNLPPGADDAAQEATRSNLTEKIAEALLTMLEKNPSRKRIQTSLTRFQQIRESFESAVTDGRFHNLKPDKAVLAVCLVPERGRGPDLSSVHGMLPPMLETTAYYEPETDRHTEISLAEGSSWKSVLDIDRHGTIRAASTLAIKGDAPPKFIRLTGAERYIRSGPLQKTLVHSLRLWAQVLRQSGVAGPFRLGVSLLAVEGWDLLLYDRKLCNRPQKEPLLSADPVPISSLADFGDAQVVFQALKPAFNDIARGFGLGEWPVFSFGTGG